MSRCRSDFIDSNSNAFKKNRCFQKFLRIILRQTREKTIFLSLPREEYEINAETEQKTAIEEEEEEGLKEVEIQDGGEGARTPLALRESFRRVTLRLA